jgi:hypothetical protein
MWNMPEVDEAMFGEGGDDPDKGECELMGFEIY